MRIVIHNLDTSLSINSSVHGSIEMQIAQTAADWEIAHEMHNKEHFLATDARRATDLASS
jgi:hypothetical protein